MTLNGLSDRVRDTAGLTTYMMGALATVEQDFYRELVEAVASRGHIRLSRERTELTIRKLMDAGIDLRSGNIEDQVLDVLADTSRESGWAEYVDDFTATRSIALSFSRRRQVLAALDRLGVDPGPDGALIAQVIDDVTRGAGTDPVQLTRPTGRTSPWNFQVDLFDGSSDQIVLEDNVRAAGALMWCYDIGERLGVFKLTDALVYRWWIGNLDFGDSDLTSELYRYYKLRDERPTEEERFLLYRRVLALGNAEVGDRVVVNDDFPSLWRTLMEEVAAYIDRSETSFRERVNRQSVVQAIREVQYNLTERMAGMALTQVTEMYNQLRQTESDSGVLGGLDILGHREVVAQLSSGRRRDEWSVIERLSKEEFGVAPNISALRTSATEAFRVVDYIASFRPGRFDDEAFDEFIASAKAWILTQQLAGDGLLVDVGGAKDESEEEFPDEFPDDIGDVDDVWAE